MKVRNKINISILFLIICSLIVNCNADGSGKAGKWHGFEKTEFSVDGRNCHVVIPEKHANGKPWVWRAGFPDWHIEMDLVLLRKGITVAYMDVSDLFGSPKAVQYWDAFYQHMIKDGYCKRPALEAVSRGGLIAYNWAKKNPEKVACIYAECPVCDIKSRPGHTNPECAGTWQKALSAYEMSQEQLLEYADNPIDNLEALAKAKVPILHIVSPADEIVPIRENTLELVSRYIQCGGIATVVSNTTEPQTLQGHHFPIPIEDVQHGVDFMITNLKKANPSMRTFFIVRDDFKNSHIAFERTKKGCVAFLGGSITTMQWPKMVSEVISKRFPEADIDFVYAGCGSMGTTQHAFRLTRDVFSKGKVDLLFVEAAVNDAANGRTPEEMIRGMEGVIRHARRINPEIDIVMMHFVDPSKMADYNKGSVPVVIQQHEKVAQHYRINSLNLALEVTERINAGEFTWEDDFKNLHPSPFGQKLYTDSIGNMLNTLWPDFLHSDDKIRSRKLPVPLDPYSYDNGRLVEIKHAQLGSDWKIDENWQPAKGSTREGFVNVPMLICETPGDALTFEFTGRGVGILVAAGYDAGMIEYSVDGGPWQKRDLLTRWSRGLHLPWLYALAADLDDSKHTLKLRVISEKNKDSQGHACRIAKFAVNR